MQIKTTLRFHVNLQEWPRSKTLMTTYAGEVVGKGNTSALLVGMQAGTAPLDVSVAISQKIRKQPSWRPINTTFGYISKRCSIMPQGHVLNYVHSSFVCHSRKLKQPKCSLTEEWIRKMWYIYTMEYYTAEKHNGSLNFAGKWMELGNIILSEVTQIQKDNYHMYSLISGL